MEDHHVAAHHVARHLRAIAELLPRLSAQGSDPLYNVLFRNGFIDQCDALKDAATLVEATAPFEPVDDATKDSLRDDFAAELADRNSREVVEDYCGDWTEAEWRMEVDGRAEYMSDE